MSITGSIRIATLAAASLIGGATLAASQACPTSPSYSSDFTAATTSPSCLAFNGVNNNTPTPYQGSPSIANPFNTQSSAVNVLQLTANQDSWATSAWYTKPQSVSNGFTTTFAFQIGNSSNGSQGDGFAFVIQNSPTVTTGTPLVTTGGLYALGAGGCAIGFGGANCGSTGGIPNSVAIELNTYNNGTSFDPSSDDVTIQNCLGTHPNSPAQTCSIKTHDLTQDPSPIKIADGRVHTVTVSYLPTGAFTCGSGTQACYAIDVILDREDLFPNNIALFDITSIGLTNGSAFVGFTAGTGAANDYHDILNWTFTSVVPTQTGVVGPSTPTSSPTTFNFNGGLSSNLSVPVGYDFTALQTDTALNLQMFVTAIPITQAACNALVAKNTNFSGAQCFVYQNGAAQNNDTSVLFEVTCTTNAGTLGSCGADSPFDAHLGTDFNFDCLENVPLQCGPPQSYLTFGLPYLTTSTTYNVPSVGFLKGEGDPNNPSHPCTPNGTLPLFNSNQIEAFKLGDTSGGAKGGSGGTTSCWVMTYLTPGELPSVSISQPANGTSYPLGTTLPASYSCSAIDNSSSLDPAVGPYLTVANCTTDINGGPGASTFDVSTLGPHTFTAYVQDSATNTNSQSVTYTVGVAPTISGPSSATFEVGAANSVMFNATGSPVPTFPTPGPLPPGLAFVDNKNGTATLSGTATGTGVFSLTITAQNGIGSAATLQFTLTAAATAPAAGKCNGLYNGTFKGNLTVSAGQACTFIGGGVTGNVTLNGGGFAASGTALGGNVLVNGGTFSIGPGVTIKGNLTVTENAKSAVPSQLCGSTVGGNLTANESGLPMAIGSGPACPGNTISGNLTVTQNSAAIAIYGNTVGGNLIDQQNSQPTQVFSNIVTGNLDCSSDASITGGGNTAKKKLGQCSTF